MGCEVSKNQVIQHKPLQQTPKSYEKVGLLKVEFNYINFFQDQKVHLNNYDYYVKISLNNKKFTSLLHHNFGKVTNIRPLYNKYQFPLNKIDAGQRELQIQIYAKQQLRRDILIGTHIENLDSLITKPKDGSTHLQQTIQCPIKKARSVKIGWANLKINFIPMRYQILIVKIQSVILRQKPINDRKVFVRMQIGEQVFQSSSSIETQYKIPQWTDAFCSFVVPVNLSHGFIQVYESGNFLNNDILLGQLNFDMKHILQQTNKNQIYHEQIKLDDYVTGTIRLQFLKTQSKVLIQNPIIYSTKKISKNVVEQQQQNQHDFKVYPEKNNFNSIVTTNISDNNQGYISPDPFPTKFQRNLNSSLSSRKQRQSHSFLPPIQPLSLKKPMSKQSTRPKFGKQSFSSKLVEEYLKNENKFQYNKQSKINHKQINKQQLLLNKSYFKNKEDSNSIYKKDHQQKGNENEILFDGQAHKVLKTQTIIIDNRKTTYQRQQLDQNQNQNIFSRRNSKRNEYNYHSNNEFNAKKNQNKLISRAQKNRFENDFQFVNDYNSNNQDENQSNNLNDLFSYYKLKKDKKKKDKKKIIIGNEPVIKFEQKQKDQQIKLAKNKQKQRQKPLIKKEYEHGYTRFNLLQSQQENMQQEKKQQDDEWQLVRFYGDQNKNLPNVNKVVERFNNQNRLQNYKTQKPEKQAPKIIKKQIKMNENNGLATSQQINIHQQKNDSILQFQNDKNYVNDQNDEKDHQKFDQNLNNLQNQIPSDIIQNRQINSN